MEKVNFVDVFKRMVDTNDPKVEMAPLTNVMNLRAVLRGTQVTIGISGNRVGAIFNGDYVGGLILIDKKRYDEIKALMEIELVTAKENKS